MHRCEVHYPAATATVPPSVQLVTHIIIHLSFESTEKGQFVNTTAEEISHDTSIETAKKSRTKVEGHAIFVPSALPRVVQFFRFRTNSSVFTSAAMTCTAQNWFVISAPSSLYFGSLLTIVARATSLFPLDRLFKNTLLSAH
jgi:hypothetical protein